MSTLGNNKVRTILKDLSECLVRELEDPKNGVPRPCVVTRIPGDAATPEYQGDCSDSSDPEQEYSCGLGWVRLVNAYMATGVGVQDNSSKNCNASLGFDINIGITRCFDPGEALSGPEETEVQDTADLTVADMVIMLKAIRCCRALADREYVIHSYAPIGPLGGQVGGSWSLSVVI